MTTAAGSERAVDVARADTALAGRAVSSGEFLAGLIVAAELDTVGRPGKLPADLFPEFPDADPALVQAVWDRALAVGLRAGRFRGAPRFHRDTLARLQGELEAAGHAAMAGLVARSLSAVSGPGVPVEGLDADVESGREH
jgi:hypothetical protein